MVAPLLVLLLITAGQPPAAGQPPCAVSEDETYGLTPENPVPIGGGALFVKARETRYLEALRGPAGQTLTYRRIGSRSAPGDEMTLLDEYEVTYEGLEKPVRLFLNAYLYWEQQAPKGFTCGRPIQLRPQLDQFKADEALRAAAQATSAVEPIPFESNVSSGRGGIWDAFRRIALARQAGSPLDGQALTRTTMAIAAYPVTCGDRLAQPTAVELLQPQGRPIPPTAPLYQGDSVTGVLPGASLPKGAVAATFPLAQPRPGDRVRITYDGPACGDGAAQVVLPVTAQPAKPLEMPRGVLPEGADPSQTRVLLQAVVDVDGRFTQAAFAGGPRHLREAALETVKSWRAEPARINGAPVLSATLLEIRFSPR